MEHRKEKSELGSNHLKKLRLFRQELQSLMNKGFKNLHKIDQFFNSKDKPEKSFNIFQSKYKQ